MTAMGSAFVTTVVHSIILATMRGIKTQYTLGGRRESNLTGVIDGDRTRNRQIHNLELYQLSYDHHYDRGFSKPRLRPTS